MTWDTWQCQKSRGERKAEAWKKCYQKYESWAG